MQLVVIFMPNNNARSGARSSPNREVAGAGVGNYTPIVIAVLLVVPFVLGFAVADLLNIGDDPAVIADDCICDECDVCEECEECPDVPIEDNLRLSIDYTPESISEDGGVDERSPLAVTNDMTMTGTNILFIPFYAMQNITITILTIKIEGSGAIAFNFSIYSTTNTLLTDAKLYSSQFSGTFGAGYLSKYPNLVISASGTYYFAVEMTSGAGMWVYNRVATSTRNIMLEGANTALYDKVMDWCLNYTVDETILPSQTSISGDGMTFSTTNTTSIEFEVFEGYFTLGILLDVLLDFDVTPILANSTVLTMTEDTVIAITFVYSFIDNVIAIQATLDDGASPETMDFPEITLIT